MQKKITARIIARYRGRNDILESLFLGAIDFRHQRFHQQSIRMYLQDL